jgi:hypothetical protein
MIRAGSRSSQPREVKFASIAMTNVKNPIIIDQGRSDHLLDSSSHSKNEVRTCTVNPLSDRCRDRLHRF